jgi:hypothetical protein
MVNVKPHLKYVLLSPFLFLILLGLGFQLDLGIVKISATTLAIYFAFGIFVGDSLGKADHFVTRLPLVSAGVLFALVGFFSIIGLIVGNNVGDIKEDSFGFVHFLLVFYCASKLPLDDLVFVWKGIVLLSFLAVFKILWINFGGMEAGWASPWQARKDPLPGLNWFRIVLNGGDIYFTFSFLTTFSLLIFSRESKWMFFESILLLGFLFAVLISLSRSSYLALGVGSIVVLTAGLVTKLVSIKRLILSMIGVCSVGAALWIVLGDVFDFQEIYLARIETYDSSEGSTYWREMETESALAEASKNLYFGNGMGATFLFPVEVSERRDNSSIMTHNVFTWVILKMGVVGLLAFIWLILDVLRNALRGIRSMRDRGGLTVIGIALPASFVSLVIISILANKMFSTEGSTFLGFALAFMSGRDQLAIAQLTHRNLG